MRSVRAVDRVIIGGMSHGVLNIVGRWFGFCHGCGCLFGRAEVFNDVANHAQRLVFVLSEVVCHPDCAVCTSAPPSSSAVTSSPVAALTRGGPARKMVPLPLTMMDSSDMAGT